MKTSVLLIVVASLVPAATGSSSDEYNCATSAAYSAFKWFGVDLTYGEVASSFSESDRRPSAFVSMKNLESVLATRGVTTESVKYQSVNMASLHAPSILLIYPTGVGPHSRGHYVFLRDVADDRACLIDPDSLGAEIRIPQRQLEQIWEGHAIRLGHGTWSNRVAVYLCALLCLTAVYQVYLTVRCVQKVRIPENGNTSV